MKKFIVFIIVTLFSSIAFGNFKNIEAWYITHNSDTVRGTMIIPLDEEGGINFAKLQWRISFMDTTGNYYRIHPGEIKSFTIVNGLEKIRYNSIETSPDNYVFARLVIDGSINLYFFYKEVLEGGWVEGSYIKNYFLGYPTSAKLDYFILIKENGEVAEARWDTFYKKIPPFFSDYRQLSKKIRTKEYKFTDIYRIVREYNRWKAGLSTGD